MSEQRGYSLNRSITLQTINGSTTTQGHKAFLSENRQKLCKIELVLRCKVFNTGTHQVEPLPLSFRSYIAHVKPSTDVNSTCTQLLNKITKAITEATDNNTNREIHSILCLDVFINSYTFENADNIPNKLKTKLVNANMSDDSTDYFRAFPEYQNII